MFKTTKQEELQKIADEYMRNMWEINDRFAKSIHDTKANQLYWRERASIEQEHTGRLQRAGA